MARITFNFAEQTQQKQYPCHGWALNSQGIRLLWLPILRLLHNSAKIRERAGADSKLTQGEWHEIRCFQDMLEKLFLSLRELHKTTTFLASCGGLDGPKQDTEGIGQTIPLFVDLAYVYLRRLADHFTRAIRYPIFEHYRSAPREFKKLKALNVSDCKQLCPLGDIETFIKAIHQNSTWFEQLRSTTLPTGEVRKGLRDALEHHPVTLSVQSSQVSGEPWKVEAYLWSVDAHQELIDPIRDIVSKICDMFTEVHRSIKWDEKYEFWVAPYGDCILTTGVDEDWTGYWPKI